MKLRITKRKLEAVPVPESGRVLVYDDALTGFGVVIHPTGRRSFFVEYGPERRRRRMTLGQFPALTVDQARDMAQAKLGAIVQGEDPLEEREARRAVPTVKQWIDGQTDAATKKHVDGYLDDVRRRKKQPRHDERYLGDVKDRWGSRPIDRVTRRDIEQARTELAKKGHTTANRWLASIRACLQAATDQGVLSKNPADGIRPYREGTPRARVLGDDEYLRVVDEIRKVDDPTVRAAFVLLLETGARKSEVLRARWTDFDLEAGLWRIPSPKAGHPQMVPLGESTVEHLKRVPKVGPWVVPGRKADRPREDLKGPWDAIRTAAEIDGVTIHDIRRTFGVHVAKTAGLHVASKLLRHSDVRVTERVYVPLGLDALREALTATHTQRGKVLEQERGKVLEKERGKVLEKERGKILKLQRKAKKA